MRCSKARGGSLSKTAVNRSETFCSTSLEVLFCGSGSSSALRWWKAQSPSNLPAMPKSLSRARNVPRFFFSIPFSSSRTSKQTNSSPTKTSSTARTHSSRLSAKVPRTAARIAFGSPASAPAEAPTHLWYASAREWMAPLSRQTLWIQGSAGRRGRSCTHLSSRASCGTSAEASSLLTSSPSRSLAKGSPSSRSRSRGPMQGSRSACRERNQPISLAGVGEPAFPAAGPTSASEASASRRMLAAATERAALKSRDEGSCCCVLGSANSTERNCEAFSNSG
mmetsp:Transcript_67711/g.201372  ORF Transcript_67711/g.201372 Transcript_67711/m.201372 type:complete len:280 (+) Transcript_67711:1476-2315(+)